MKHLLSAIARLLDRSDAATVAGFIALLAVGAAIVALAVGQAAVAIIKAL